MNTTEELRTTRAMVEQFLAKDIRCRNSDKYLVFCVLQEIAIRNGSKLFIPFECFERFPAYETISRIRRAIQNNEGKYPPTDQNVLIKRQRKEKRFRDEFSPKRMENI